MRQEKIILIMMIAAALLLMGCSAKSPLTKEDASVNANDYTAIAKPELSTHNTYSLVKPADWQELQYASNIIIYLPPESILNDSFSEKYSMMVGIIQENNTLPLKELTDADMEKSKEIMPGFEVVGEYKDIRLGNVDGLRVGFVMRVNDRNVEATQLRAMQGNRIYAFTQQCVIGECKHTDIFNEMAGSFEWRNP